MGLMENRGFEVSAEYVKRFSKDLTVSSAETSPLPATR